MEKALELHGCLGRLHRGGGGFHLSSTQINRHDGLRVINVLRVKTVQVCPFCDHHMRCEKE